MKLGKLGVWTFFDGVTAESLGIAKRIEALGYAALWVPEARGRNVLVHAAWLLAGTSKLIVASGIANIYARDAMAMAAAQRGLNEQSNGRFLLGLGVSASADGQHPARSRLRQAGSDDASVSGRDAGDHLSGIAAP